MKKIQKFITDYKEHGEAHAKISIGIWHVIAIAALVLLSFYLFKWR